MRQFLCNIGYEDSPKKGDILTLSEETNHFFYFVEHQEYGFRKEGFSLYCEFTENIINWLMIAKDIPYEG